MNPKKTIKDSLFTSIFGEEKYVLQLYKALHPEDQENITEEDISILTIENALVNDIYNDLGFQVKDRLIVLVEAQSTWSPNIIVRMLLYLAKTYQNYIDVHETMKATLYGSTKIHLPEPELYVIYTGNRGSREDTVSLKELFFPESDVIELKAKVIFADDGNDNIIGEYLTFCAVLREQLQKYPDDKKKAVQETIKICIEQGDLAEYLQSHKKEVEDVMITLYTQEELTESYIALKRQEGLQEGRKEGLQEGRKEGLQDGRKEGLQESISNLMLNLGFSFEKALDVLGIPAEERKLYHP